MQLWALIKRTSQKVIINAKRGAMLCLPKTPVVLRLSAKSVSNTEIEARGLAEGVKRRVALKSLLKFQEQHPYHLVDHSPWPLLTAFCVGCLAIGLALYFNKYGVYGVKSISLSIKLLLLAVTLWWRDVIREAHLGDHTLKVQKGLLFGMALFIVSEVLFFFAFFWSYFYFSFNPLFLIGAVWPPVGMETIQPFELPLFNTVLLLTSGATLTWAHHALLQRDIAKIAGPLLFLTVFLGCIFIGAQALEYTDAPFFISDSVFSSIFYLMTAFHGAHVLIGACFLMVCAIRLQKGHFTPTQHVGLEAAAWYWHFVDVVWLLLYFIVYIWGVL